MKKPLLFLNADGGEGSAAPADVSAAPPAPPATTPAPWTGEDGSFAEGWLDRLPPELADIKPTAAKYKSVPEFLKAHHHLNQRLGRHATAVYVPGEDATPEEVAAYRTRLGVPESPDGYQLKPEKLPDGLEWDDERVKPYAELAHRHNIPAAAMKELAALQLQQEADMAKGFEAMEKEALEKGHATLRGEWGDKYDANMLRAKQYASTIGLPLDHPNLMDPQFVKAMARGADLISDDKLVIGEHNPSLQAGVTRANDIINNPANPNYARYYAGDPVTVKLVTDLMATG